jgi:hypothetical protein
MFEHRDNVVALQGEPGVAFLGLEQPHLAVVLGRILGDGSTGRVTVLGLGDRGVERVRALGVKLMVVGIVGVVVAAVGAPDGLDRWA